MVDVAKHVSGENWSVCSRNIVFNSSHGINENAVPGDICREEHQIVISDFLTAGVIRISTVSQLTKPIKEESHAHFTGTLHILLIEIWWFFRRCENDK